MIVSNVDYTIKGVLMSNILVMRVSTQPQCLQRQEVLKDKYAIDKVFAEHISGKTIKDRPAIKAMLDYVREGDCVYCLSLDRLGRNLKELKEIVEEILPNIKSVSELRIIKEENYF